MAKTPEQAVKAVAERAKIDKVTPTRKQLAEALGPFKTCSEPTHVVEADGSDQVNITSEKADGAENRRRWETYTDLTSGKRALEIERSHRRGAEEETVTVFDVRTDEERPIPVHQEDNVARKPWARASRGRKVFVGAHFSRSR